MIAVRKAKASDRNEILSFCRATFSWGDYIEEVWDLWLSEGKLLVAVADGKKVGLSHLSVCPGSGGIWVEGIRVHPAYRRAKIATALISEMLHYGVEAGARTALAIVSADNRPSQLMMKRMGFHAISEWSYYVATESTPVQAMRARLASERDLDAIMGYLDKSRIYRRSAKKYVQSWRWYPLDRNSIAKLIADNRVVVSGDPVAGVAVINTAGYWNKTDAIQVVYLDATRKEMLRDIVAYAANIYSAGSYDRLQLLFPSDRKTTLAVKEIGASRSEQFILYSKKLSP